MPDFVRASGVLHHIKWSDQGSDLPIVFVNSLGTDFRIWDDVIAALPSSVSVLTYDKSGHGLSEDGARSIEDYAEELIALMKACGAFPALICGVSIGGLIAQAAAAIRPDFASGLLLSNTSDRIGDKKAWESRIAALDEGGINTIADDVMERWFSARFRSAEPEQSAGYREMLVRTPLAGYRAACGAIRDADLTDRAREIACPTICVAGSDDLATPPDIVRRLSQLIPGAGYLELDGVGHLPCIETPAKLAEVLMDLREQVR